MSYLVQDKKKKFKMCSAILISCDEIFFITFIHFFFNIILDNTIKNILISIIRYRFVAITYK